MDMSVQRPLSADQIESHNAARVEALHDDYASLGRALNRRGIAIDGIKTKITNFSVALPTWGSGVGGTRFAKFPIPGEPTNIHEKLEDCAVVQQLCRATPRVSPHFPWDKVSDYRALREEAAALGLGFDAVNSNTFQDQPGQPHSYRNGSLTSTGSSWARRRSRSGSATARTSLANRISAARLSATFPRHRRFMRRCPMAGACCWSTSSTSRRFIPP
jgi:L-rhamnose isomerase